MNKKIMFLLFLFLIAQMPFITSADAAVTAGDVNADGKVNVVDAAMLKSVVIKKKPESIFSNKAAADMNVDGVINSIDYLLLKKKIQDDAFKTSAFAKGADISWLPQMEANGYKFYNDAGVQQDCLQILKDHGVDSVRIRTWVNPSTDEWNGHCSTSDTVALAKRAKKMNFKIMVDLHYSDSWADPGQQTKPYAWKDLSFDALMKYTYDYTYYVMTQLKDNGISPDWVQVGNETNDGMLWEEGRASNNMKNFAWLVNCGYDAVKAANPQTKVIVHLSNGFDNSLFRWMFDGLNSNGAKYDVIGMSLYPEKDTYSSLANECLSNMKDMVSRYNKEVMICEVGMGYDSPSECKAFISDMIAKTRSLPNDKGLGVFYWEPESYPGMNGYNKGVWNSNGKPTAALDAFLN